jgi:hypothetical protein
MLGLSAALSLSLLPKALRKNATLCPFLPHFPSILALLASDFSAASSATSNGHSVGHSGGVPV